MKKKFVVLFLVLVLLFFVLINYWAPVEASAPSPFHRRFTREHLGNYMYVIVDEVTGVCYFAHLGNNAGGLCAMVDADGTPLTYSEAWDQVFGEATNAK